MPDFRLPKDVVDRETGAIVASGVQVHTNVTVGRDITLQSLLDTYDATILAVGLWKERRLDIPGKEHLVPAVGWLSAPRSNASPSPGKPWSSSAAAGSPLTAPSPPAPQRRCRTYRLPRTYRRHAHTRRGGAASPRRRHRHPQQPPQPRRRLGRRTPSLRGPARNLVLL
ncbi:MAG: hypothetical protein ACLSHC_03455 [Bilophila wadsworthia]